MKKTIQILSIAFIFILINNQSASAQCGMCKRVAETNIESGQKQGLGLNGGILYLMSIPYIMGGVAGFIWWRNSKKTHHSA